MVRRVVIVALWLAVAVSLAPAAWAQGGRDYGRTKVGVPDPVTAGEWTGTWVFESRVEKIAIWLRERSGVIEMRVKQVKQTNAETWMTDWDGTTSYDFPKLDGEVAIRLTDNGEDELHGTWYWQSKRGATLVRTEEGRFTIFRTLDGRYLVLRFDELLIRRQDGDSNLVSEPVRVLQFRKSSRRLVDWEELPF